MAEAAKHAGVQHVIWSTLEDTRLRVPLRDDRMPTLMGKYKVPHFDAKGESDHFFSDRGVPTTFLRTSFYWDNFIHFGMGPKKGPDGMLALTLPMGDAEAAGHRGRGHRPPARYGVFKRAGSRRQDGRHRGRAPDRRRRWRRRSRGARPDGALQRGHARRLSRASASRRGGPGQHVPVQARLQRGVLRARATSTSRASSTRSCSRWTSGWTGNAKRIPSIEAPGWRAVKVILFGATGMVGQGDPFSSACCDADVESVLCVGRRGHGPVAREAARRGRCPTSRTSRRSRASWAGWTPASSASACPPRRACAEEDYRRITYDTTLAVARSARRAQPSLTFVYVSGASTDSSERGRIMWARVKGGPRTRSCGCRSRRAYMFRPGYIQPLGRHPGQHARDPDPVRGVRAALPSLETAVPALRDDDPPAGPRAMIEAARRGAPGRCSRVPDINALRARRVGPWPSRFGLYEPGTDRMQIDSAVPRVDHDHRERERHHLRAP